MKLMLLLLAAAFMIGCSSRQPFVGRWSAQNPPPGVTNWTATFQPDGGIEIAYDAEQIATKPTTITRRSDGKWSQIDPRRASVVMKYEQYEEHAMARLSGTDHLVLTEEKSSHPDLVLRRER